MKAGLFIGLAIVIRYFFSILLVFITVSTAFAVDSPEEVPARRDPPHPGYTGDGKANCLPFGGQQYVWLANPAGGGRCYGHRIPNQAYCPKGYMWKGQTPNDWELRTNRYLTCIKKKEGCVAPLIDDGNGGCKDPCAEKAGKTASSGVFDWGTSPTSDRSKGCNGGCGVIFSGWQAQSRAMVGGKYHYYAKGSYEYDGVSCKMGEDPDSAPPSAGDAPPKDTCAEGQDSAQMNGVTKCYDRKTREETNPDTNKDEPPDASGSCQPGWVKRAGVCSCPGFIDGRGACTQTNPNPPTTTNDSTTTSPDGTKTTTSITCNASGCVTTVTTERPDGTKTTTTTGGKPNNPKTPNDSNPKDPKDDDKKDGKPWGKPGTQKGKYDGIEGKQAEAQQKLTEYYDKMRQESAGLWKDINLAGGSLPRDVIETSKGKVSMDLNEYANVLAFIPALFKLITTLVCFFIFFRS